MKRLVSLLAFGVLAACLAGQAARAQDQPAGQANRARLPVKQYKIVQAGDVYKAALAGTQANVQFQDTFAGLTAVPDGLSRLTPDGADLGAVAAFRTGADLVCLLTPSAPAALRAVFGVPPEVPLTAAALTGPAALFDRQQMAVEGTILGSDALGRYVVVDTIYLGAVPARAGQRAVDLYLPGRAEPATLTAPQTTMLPFRCSYVQGQTEQLTVAIEALGYEARAARVADVTGRGEGLGGPKAYGLYDPVAVYRHAGNPQARVNADFTDRVAAVLPSPVPDELAAAPAFRQGALVQLPVAAAFETEGRVTCLVTAVWPTVLNQALALLPGERVRVRGTTVGPTGSRNCMLVDDISLPDREAARPDGTWWVALSLGEGQPQTAVWDYGVYSVDGLPCRFRPGAYEAVGLVFMEWQWYEVPMAVPAQPAPAPVQPAAAPQQPVQPAPEEPAAVPEESAPQEQPVPDAP